MPDALALHVDVAGAGPAVVLAHGFAGSARNFRPQVRVLRDTHRVACYDARGHARSPAPEDPTAYDMGALVGDFASVASGLGTSTCVAGGLSLGAAVSLRFALDHPARVRGLVLASYPSGRGEASGFSGSAEAFAAALEQRGLDAAGAEFVWGPRSGLDEAGARLVRRGFLEHSAFALAAILRGVLASLPTPSEMAGELASLRVPTLVVAGERDAGSLRASRALAELLPVASLEVIPNAGHVVNLAQPAEFNAVLTEFLAGLPD